MVKIFIINGYPGSGKDTFVDICNRYIKCMNISTITPVKELLHGITGDRKDEKERNLMQEVKASLKKYNDYCFNETCIQIDIIIKYGERKLFIFVHCREPEEIKQFINHYNCKTILIKKNSDQIFNNTSDNNVENFDYDYVIENLGTMDDLQNKAKEFIKEIENGLGNTNKI